MNDRNKMKPTILKVFSIFPKQEKIHQDLTRKNDENSIIKISHFNCENQNQLTRESLSNINEEESNEDFEMYNYDSVSNNDYNREVNKEWNVLDDFYRFQERRNAFLDNKKANNNGVPAQKATFERPNYSYTQLIYMAIESSSGRALTVNDIYNWCEQNFPYYANATHGWKNSLRHNLSINKCFKKITKLGVGGRGSLWIVDPRERQHLVSTMHRSNVSSYQGPPIFIQTRTSNVERVLNEEAVECVQVQCGDAMNELTIFEEKPRQEWTDTKLKSHIGPLSPNNESVSSETDFNDWHRSISTLEPIYPIKTHWCNQFVITPCHLPDHNYSVPDIETVFNNPFSIMRHSFVPATNPLDSFSTSSDYNDEDWPRTPSPISLHTTEPILSNNEQRPVKSTGKKRGRPRKDESQNNLKILRSHLQRSPIKYNSQSLHNPSDRLNNLYNLNTFFNSL